MYTASEFRLCLLTQLELRQLSSKSVTLETWRGFRSSGLGFRVHPEAAIGLNHRMHLNASGVSYYVVEHMFIKKIGIGALCMVESLQISVPTFIFVSRPNEAIAAPLEQFARKCRMRGGAVDRCRICELNQAG